MIPSKRWFPTTLIDRSAWVSNFAKNFANVALDLGFTAADIDSMNKDAEDLQALARSITAAEAFMSGLGGFRVLVDRSIARFAAACFSDFDPYAAAEWRSGRNI